MREQVGRRLDQVAARREVQRPARVLGARRTHRAEGEQRLIQATQSSREDLARLCELLRKVIKVFSDPKAGAYDLASLQRVVSLAEASHQRLADEVRAFVQNLEAEDLLEKLNVRIPTEPAPADAKTSTPGALPAGPEQPS